MTYINDKKIAEIRIALGVIIRQVPLSDKYHYQTTVILRQVARIDRLLLETKS